MSKGVARKGFDLDLEFGEMAEGKLGEILKAKGEKVEVKCDDGFRETGNIFVEYSCNGKPSGVATTEAKWWAVEFCEDGYLVLSVERVKRWARYYMEKGTRYHKSRAGDGGRVKGVVVPLVSWLDEPGLMENLRREDFDAFGTTRRK